MYNENHIREILSDKTGLHMIDVIKEESRKLLDFMSKRVIFGEGLYTKGSLIDYTITYIQQLEETKVEGEKK